MSLLFLNRSSPLKVDNIQIDYNKTAKETHPTINNTNSLPQSLIGSPYLRFTNKNLIRGDMYARKSRVNFLKFVKKRNGTGRDMEKLKSEMTQSELRDLEAEDFRIGPLATLTRSVKERTLVLISCRNNKRLLGRVKAFDRHCNMVLEGVKELWTEGGKKKKGKPVNRDRFISKMFLRGDSVVLIVMTNISSDTNNQ